MSLRTVSALRRTLWRRAVTLLLNVTRAVSATFTTLTSSAYSRTTAQTATQTLTVKDAEDAAMAGVPWAGVAYRASPSASLSTVSASPAAITNDGVDAAVVTVRAMDALNGFPMAGYPAASIAMSASGSGNTFTAIDSACDANGDCRFSFVTTGAATKTITAVIGGVTVTDTATVVASGTAVTNPDNLRPSDYGALVFREFNSKAASDGDRGTGSFPSKTGGSEGWDGGEWNDANLEIPTAESGLAWLSGSAPFGDGSNNVMVTQFPAGLSGIGVSPGVTQTQTLSGAPTRLWVQFSIAFEDTFEAGPANLNKLFFMWLTGASGGTFVGVYSGAFRFNLQSTPDNGRGYLTNNLNAGAAAVTTDGRWYTVCLELITTGNSATGQFRMWIADNDSVGKEFVKVAEYTDINYGFTSWSHLQWAPVWGGADAGRTVITEFNYAVDTVKVWGY